MARIKVYLDDVRDAPVGWRRTYTVRETIDLIREGKVSELSLDHDLGDTDPEHSGYDVLSWLESEIALRHDYYFAPTSIFLHTQNPVGKERMKRAIESIERLKLHVSYENT